MNKVSYPIKKPVKLMNVTRNKLYIKQNTCCELNSIVVKLGRRVPGSNIPHEIKITLFVGKFDFLSLNFFYLQCYILY